MASGLPPEETESQDHTIGRQWCWKQCCSCDSKAEIGSSGFHWIPRYHGVAAEENHTQLQEQQVAWEQSVCGQEPLSCNRPYCGPSQVEHPNIFQVLLEIKNDSICRITGDEWGKAPDTVDLSAQLPCGLGITHQVQLFP